MTHHQGNLVVTRSNFNYARALTSVEGYLYVKAANARLTALTSVGGTLYIKADGAKLTALTRVGGYPFAWPDPDVARTRLIDVARHALATPDALDTKVWHKCETTHCIAGWAIHLAGAEGAELERMFGSASAGLALLGLDGAKKFWWPTDKARTWLQSVLAEST
jgi:hypothetical protein